MYRIALTDKVDLQVPVPRIKIRITKLSETETVTLIFASVESLDELTSFIRRYQYWGITITAFPGETFDVERFDKTNPPPPGQSETGTLEQVNSLPLPREGTIATMMYF